MVSKILGNVDLYDLYINKKLSIAKISKLLSCGKTTVDYNLKKRNIKLRSRSEALSNKFNPMWKGNKIKYGSLHDWIKWHKIKLEKCECCGITSRCDLANISQEYKRDINDFEWLCRSCHMKKDGRLTNLRYYNQQYWKQKKTLPIKNALKKM